MSYQHPLNIKVKESYYVENTRHCPILMFRYTKDGTEKSIGYMFGYYKQKKAATDYANLKNIPIDASGITDKESAQTFYEESLAPFPVPEGIDKHLSEFESLNDEKKHRWALEATLKDTLNNIVFYNRTPQDTAEMHGFLKELLEHVAKGKDIRDFKIKGATRYEWGIGSSHNINMYHCKKRAMRDLGNLDGLPAEWPQETVITPAVAQRVLSKLPETPFSNRDAAYDFAQDIAYDGNYQTFNRQFNQTLDTIMRDFVAVSSREIMSERLGKAVRIQLRKLEKEARTKQKAEAIKQHREEARIRNAAEGQKKKEAALKKTAARKRLAKKGLIAASPDNGTAYHWGDAPKQHNR